jgi:hypothetical protein
MAHAAEGRLVSNLQSRRSLIKLSLAYRMLVLAVGLILPAGAACSEPASLSSDADRLDTTSLTAEELHQAISEKTVYLNVSGFELPIRYAANGRMTGSMGAVVANFSRGDGARDNGRWWIEANQLCQHWTSWLEGKTYCYKLTREGDAVNWSRNDGASGTARIGD